MKSKILYIDMFCDPAIKAAFEDMNYMVECVPKGEEGLRAVKSEKYNLVILSSDLEFNCLVLLEFIKEFDPSLPVIFVCNRGSKLLTECKEKGADDILAMPFHYDELVEKVQKLTNIKN